MALYRAGQDQEDRDGEMTGAITVNMIVSMLPVGIWSFFVGPLLGSVWLTATVAVVMAILLPIVLLPASRSVWAWMSERADRV